MVTAASGASATLVSDAFMNPFDGMTLLPLHGALLILRNSHQAAYASARLHLQVDIAMHQVRLPERGPSRILRLVPYNDRHDCAHYGATIFCLWVYIPISQPVEEPQPMDAHDCGGLGWRFCGRSDHPAGRDQDASTDKRHRSRPTA